uniref:Uncharacterized protein n=1 Tax=Candidatus Kentrum sp. LPFa TaxID=2126335 RepID=A0A450VXQ9_9GAMM|nr:MAG: hypothetical protein BECKLPF1236B_GA0070989_10109 [Candidatus Kentron sp. LPFa]
MIRVTEIPGSGLVFIAIHGDWIPAIPAGMTEVVKVNRENSENNICNPASEALPRTDKSMNRVLLRFDLEIKPKFNDPVIPAWKPGSSAMDGTLIARKYLLLDFRHQWNDVSP